MRGIEIGSLLSIEDDETLISWCEPVTCVPAWMLVRNYFLRAAIEDSVSDQGAVPRYSPSYKISDLIMSAGVSWLSERRERNTISPVVFLGSGAGLIFREGGTFDRLTGYFSEQLGEKAWTQSGIYQFNWRHRITAPRTTLTDHHRLLDHARNRLRVRTAHREMARDVIECAQKRLQNQMGFRLKSEVQDGITNRLALELASVPAVSARVSRLIRRHEPKIIICDMACYGTNSLFNKLCQLRGVEVVEYQHGVVTKAHEAYNFGGNWIQRPNAVAALPSVILLYGSWWGTQMNVPIRKVVIGNPHRSWSLGDPYQIESRRTDVLVLGNGVDTADHQQFCKELQLRCPLWRVVFRPHPKERAVVINEHDGSHTTYAIDVTPDIYKSFKSAAWVVAEFSTALFEAAGAGPRVAMICTPKSAFYLPDSPFLRITLPSELADRIAASEDVPSEDMGNEIWASDWSGRFEQFMTRERSIRDRATLNVSS